MVVVLISCERGLAILVLLVGFRVGWLFCVVGFGFSQLLVVV